MYIIAGAYKHRKIATPKGLATRPTAGQLRGALFNICQNYIEGARFLDLFAGSGAMGLEALSRGAVSATFIDSDRESIRCIQQNLRNLKLEGQARVLSGDVFHLVKKLAEQGAQYDIIYVDPPYGASSKLMGKDILHVDQVMQLIDKGTLLAPAGELFIETASDAPPTIATLQRLTLASSRRMGLASLHQFH